MRRFALIGVAVLACDLIPERLEEGPPHQSMNAGGAAGESGDAGEGGAAGGGGTSGEAGARGGAGGGAARRITFEPIAEVPASITPLTAVSMRRGPGLGVREDIHLFWVASDRAIHHLAHDGVSLRHALVGEPSDVAVAGLSGADDVVTIFVPAPSGGMLHKGAVDGRWSHPNPSEWWTFPGPILGELTATYWTADDLDVFGIDELGSVHHLKWRVVGAWDLEWQELAGIEASGKVAAAALTADRTIRLFARTPSGGLMARVYSELGSSGQWEVPPFCSADPSCPCDQLKEPPAVSAVGPSHLGLVLRTAADELWFVLGSSAGWSCRSLSGSTTMSPVLLSRPPSRLDLFRSDEGGLQVSSWSLLSDPEWSPWRSLEATFVDIAVASTSPTLTHVFGRTSDGAIHHGELGEEP